MRLAAAWTASVLAALLGGGVMLGAGALPEEAAAPSRDDAEGETPAFKQVVVVTASRTEELLHDVPSSMTVLDSRALEQIPADDLGDYLRNVPGLNVSQMSARDVQVTGRAATFSLATSELVLLDNRSLYLDFFGFVMWDFAPTDPYEIKQIEVVRGPGSAVWGANAMSGVINMITKSPREMPGTSVVIQGGELGTAGASVTHAGTRGRLGYKLNASFYEQDAYRRPSGTIPGTQTDFDPDGTPYPDFENQGTRQPKASLRFDFDADDETTWSVSGGYSGTDGIIHSGIGPFDIASGTSMRFVKADWTRKSARVTFSLSSLDGDADNLLTRDPGGLPLTFGFKSDTYNLDYSDTTVIHGRHILTFGANVRSNVFDLTLAPKGDARKEAGLFFQDQIILTDRVRWLIGARLDDIDPIDSVVSPRTSLMVRTGEHHSIRFSFNRAFKAPSMVQNYLDITIIADVIDLSPAGGPAAFPVLSDALGNLALQEEQLDAFEIGYVGSFGTTTVTASVYRNETEGSQDFFADGLYTSASPPPEWPAGLEFLLDLPPDMGGLAGLLPSGFNYRNVGRIIDQGVELSVGLQPAPRWSVFGNYSFQDEPNVEGIPQETLPGGMVRDAVNTPPAHRFNLGAGFQGDRWFASANINFADDAFWTDVLDARFWGPTESYMQLNLSGGVRLNDRLTLSVDAQNLFDETVVQHVFGDIISRKVTGRLVFRTR